MFTHHLPIWNWVVTLSDRRDLVKREVSMTESEYHIWHQVCGQPEKEETEYSKPKISIQHAL